jgi:hypothetical protein
MIRFTKALALAATLLIVPSIASAIGVSITNSPSNVLAAGGSVTFDLEIDQNSIPLSLNGLQVSLTGYDLPGANFDRELGLAFGGGTATSSLYGTHVPTVGIFNDLQNNNGSAPVEVFEVNHLNPQAYTVSLFEAVSLTSSTGDGSLDDRTFQVTLNNVLDTLAPAYANLSFNVTTIDNLGNEVTTSTPFALTVIPEPGTALLMGLGLAGLASRRR